jgi:hypothetical protein
MKRLRILLPVVAIAALGFGVGLGFSSAVQASPCTSYCYAEFHACKLAANNLSEVRECVIERNACIAGCSG